MSDFDEIDRLLGTDDAGTDLAKYKPSPDTWVEDQGAANEFIGELYESMGFKRPKTVWAQSPRVLHEAIERMRNIHVGMRHNFIDAMVPYDQDTLRRESQKVLLEALIERDLTVSMGASLQRQIAGKRTPWEYGQLPQALNHALQPENLGRNTAPAGWGDVCVYSTPDLSRVAWQQTFCFCPYMRICWMCSPLKESVQREDGWLYVWRDGWTMFVPHEKPLEIEDGTEEIEAPKNPLLEQINKKLLEGSHE